MTILSVPSSTKKQVNNPDNNTVNPDIDLVNANNGNVNTENQTGSNENTANEVLVSNNEPNINAGINNAGVPNPIVAYANFNEAAQKVGYIPLYIPKKSLVISSESNHKDSLDVLFLSVFCFDLTPK